MRFSEKIFILSFLALAFDLDENRRLEIGENLLTWMLES